MINNLVVNALSFVSSCRLLMSSQAAYPPNHYIRRCPQRKIHLFTLCQLTQLGIMCFFGFSPWSYVKMVFPVIILLLLPVRYVCLSWVPLLTDYSMT